MLDPSLIANLHNYIAINPQLAIVGERLQLKRLVPMAVDRAIVEIISPVVDRSVTIACMTTQVRLGGGRAGWHRSRLRA
jgi:CCR4-NOT transcription complex subunit 1